MTVLAVLTRIGRLLGRLLAGASRRVDSSTPETWRSRPRYASRRTGFGRCRMVGRTASTNRARPPGVSQIVHARVRIDEVIDDRPCVADGIAPGSRGLAQHLVGVLALGQANDPDVVQLDPGVVARELPDERFQARRAQRARLLAGRVDVVGERDPAPVARALPYRMRQRDLARRERRAQGCDDVLEARLVGHERVGVALDDDRLAALADGALGAVDEIQRPALVEQRGRRDAGTSGPSPAGIRQHPPPEADGMAVRVADGNRTRSRKKS